MKTCLDRRIDDKVEREFMRDPLIAYTRAFDDAIEWFKETLWHERDEEPTEEGAIIKRLFKKGETYLTIFNWVKVKDDIIESHKNIGCTKDEIALYVRIAWKECGNFDMWCYLADLLPKGGEK
mgnify:FL=1